MNIINNNFTNKLKDFPTYLYSKMRQRNNNISYLVEVNTPVGEIEHIEDIKNLEDIALYINTTYFNGFEVVSRAMVSNWLYLPDNKRRSFAQRFNIKRIDNTDDTKSPTTPYPISV